MKNIFNNFNEEKFKKLNSETKTFNNKIKIINGYKILLNKIGFDQTKIENKIYFIYNKKY